MKKTKTKKQKFYTMTGFYEDCNDVCSPEVFDHNPSLEEIVEVARNQFGWDDGIFAILRYNSRGDIKTEYVDENGTLIEGDFNDYNHPAADMFCKIEWTNAIGKKK